MDADIQLAGVKPMPRPNADPTAGTANKLDPRSVSIGVNAGVVSTGDGAVIDARVTHLPAQAARAPADVAAAPGLHNLPAPGNPVSLTGRTP